MKNYSRILTIFALTPMAYLYLTPMLQKYNLSLEDFTQFVNQRKKAANCIKGLRDSFLLVTNADSEEVTACKLVFQQISVVFLKSFCVNWIFNGKLVDKRAHLKYRFKILRRIRNPETFTYLEDCYLQD